MNKSLIIAKLQSILTVGNRKLYVMIVPTKTNKKEVQFLCVNNQAIKNITREIGIVTDRKFTKNNRSLIVTDVELVADDLSACLGSDKFELFCL